MKALAIIPCLLVFISFASAQQLMPTIIATTGEFTSVSTFSLEWTLGELAVNAFEVNDHQITEGFHQPSLSTSIDTVEGFDFTIKIFPNPTSEILYCQVSSVIPDTELKFILFNVLGQRVLDYQQSLIDPIIPIDLQHLPSSSYFLAVYVGTHTGKSLFKYYKIIKTSL